MQTKTYNGQKWAIKKLPRLKAALLTVIFILSTAVALPILQSTDVGAVKTISKMTFLQQIDSYLYYKALTSCFKHAQLSGTAPEGGAAIETGDIDTYNWFGSNSISNDHEVTVGSYMEGKLPVNDEGQIKCGGGNPDDKRLVAGAMKLWDLDATRVLCNSNFIRDDLGDSQSVDACIRAETKVLRRRGDDRNASATAFVNYIKRVVYGGQRIQLTNAQAYIFLRHTLNQTCIPGIDNTRPDSTPTGDDNEVGYNGVKWVDEARNRVITGSYSGNLAPGDSIRFGVNNNYDNEERTCQQIVQNMNSFADAYRMWRQTNPDEPTTPTTPDDETGDEEDPSCGSQVTALGWIMCPVINGLGELNDVMWNIIDGLLVVNPLDSPTAQGSQSKTIYAAWGSIRSIANIIFVIFFLIIIFSQLTGAGITNYGVKKLMPKIIICAIMVNISYVLMQVAVDLANIVGASLYDVIAGMTPDPPATWKTILTSWGAIAGGVALVGAVTIAPAVFAWAVLPLIAMAALGLLTAVLTLIFRQAAIPLLAILAPLAFVAYLLPNTETWFKRWRGLLISMLMLYPLAALVFAGARFAGVAIMGDGNSMWNNVIGLVIMALPFFSLPFLARQGGPLLSRVNGALTGLANRARQPITNMSRDRGAAARARWINQDPENYRNPAHRWARRFGRERAVAGQMRRQNMESDRQEFSDDVNNSRVLGLTGQRIDSRQSYDRANLAKRNAAATAKESDTRITQNNPIRHGEGINQREYRVGQTAEAVKNETSRDLHNDTSFDTLRTRVDHSASDAKAAENYAAARVERDPTTLQVRRRAFDADAVLKTEQKITESALANDTTLDARRTALQEETILAGAATDAASARVERTDPVRYAKSQAAGAKMVLEQAEGETEQAIADNTYMNLDNTRAGLEVQKQLTTASTDEAARRVESRTSVKAAKSQAAGAKMRLEGEQADTATYIAFDPARDADRQLLKERKHYQRGAEAVADAAADLAPTVIEAKALADAAEDDKASAGKVVDKIIGDAKRGVATPGIITAATAATAQAARHGLEETTLEAKESEDLLETGLKLDESLDEARLRADAAKRASDNASSKITQLADEAATSVVAEPGSRLAGISDTTRDRLQDLDDDAFETASATGEAKRRRTTEKTTAILDDSTGMAARAAGIGGTQGQARAKATSVNIQAGQRRDDIVAARSHFSQAGYASGDRPGEPNGELIRIALGDVGDPTKRDGELATEEDISAAMQMVLETGSIDAEELLFNKLAAMPDGPEKIRLQQDFAAAKHSKSIRGAIKGQLQAGSVGMDGGITKKTDFVAGLTPFQQAAAELLRSGKFSEDTFSGADNSELKKWATVLGMPGVLDSISPDRRDAIIRNIAGAYSNENTVKDITDEKDGSLRTIVGAITGTPPTTWPPVSTPPTAGGGPGGPAGGAGI